MTGRAATYRPDRRHLLAAAAAMLAAAGFSPRMGSAQPAAPRLAAIDWAMMETAMFIGHMPVAAAELLQFRETVPPGLVPGEVVDLGLRGSPNYELLQLILPDLILSSPYYTAYEQRLQQIAPVISLEFFVPSEPPLPKALQALSLLAEGIGDPDAGRRAQQKAGQALASAASGLRDLVDRPLCLVEVGDSRHLRTFGFDSLFGSTLDHMGLQNGWSGQTEFSFLAPVPIERLADFPDAAIIVIGPVPPEALRSLSRSVLWRALPAVSEGRVYQLPALNAFGGAWSAVAFARALETAMRSGPVGALA
ncbi:ABC transporter substrate-binding protein [Paracoccus aerodenitrificans]|uniref:ABC transporter substrate-binding protein n=1 Tax=Paracoccus aerodenitrificans TaxID=3017781 RepID=UPI0022F1371D|nr:ABC transporter substrate-binding protein [Paracoccus aerodenitrificans]